MSTTTGRERYDLARQEFYSVKHRTDDIPTALIAAFDVLVRPALRPTPDAPPRFTNITDAVCIDGPNCQCSDIHPGTPDAGPGRDTPPAWAVKMREPLTDEEERDFVALAHAGNLRGDPLAYVRAAETVMRRRVLGLLGLDEFPRMDSLASRGLDTQTEGPAHD